MLARAVIVAYVQRDWEALARLKTATWLATRRRHGVAGAFRAADALRVQVLAQRPDWPTADERLEDVRTHVRVSQALRRVASRRR